MTQPMGRYALLIQRVFLDRYIEGATEILFSREDVIFTAQQLAVEVPKNIGDVMYSFRFRNALPAGVLAVAPEGSEWVIAGAGRGKYKFVLASSSRVVPSQSLVAIKIPDATPQIITRYAMGDEQSLLAKIRYNRLIDTFLSLTTSSLQNHLRTTVKGIGQIEIDELYIGVNQSGSHFIIPVQAKGGTDQIGVVQTQQDLAFCADRFPNLVPRAVATKFLENGVIAMFELVLVGDSVTAIIERHYQLVSGDEITESDLNTYRHL